MLNFINAVSRLMLPVALAHPPTLSVLVHQPEAQRAGQGLCCRADPRGRFRFPLIVAVRTEGGRQDVRLPPPRRTSAMATDDRPRSKRRAPEGNRNRARTVGTANVVL